MNMFYLNKIKCGLYVSYLKYFHRENVKHVVLREITYSNMIIHNLCF